MRLCMRQALSICPSLGRSGSGTSATGTKIFRTARFFSRPYCYNAERGRIQWAAPIARRTRIAAASMNAADFSCALFAVGRRSFGLGSSCWRRTSTSCVVLSENLSRQRESSIERRNWFVG